MSDMTKEQSNDRICFTCGEWYVSNEGESYNILCACGCGKQRERFICPKCLERKIVTCSICARKAFKATMTKGVCNCCRQKEVATNGKHK